MRGRRAERREGSPNGLERIGGGEGATVGYPCVTVRTPAVVICITAFVLLAGVVASAWPVGKCRTVVTRNVCYIDARAVWHVSRVVSGIWANTVFDVWLLRHYRAHKSLRAFKVPRLCAGGLRLLSAAVPI